MKSRFTGILTLFMAFMIQFSFAQEKTITGVVTSAEDNLPLPGASVVIDGTSRGASTDLDGKYSITANQGDKLVFSFIGMESQTITVGASNTVNVVLVSDNVIPTVLVTTGYQVKRPEDIIGSIKVVTKEDVGDQKITNVAEALQGFTGVQVVNNSGQPGSSPTIRLRGPASLSGNMDPLIILDGYEFKGNLNALNYDDIETYSVLKDADAVAIYGNRGARGVIVITTKKGKQGQSQFNVGMSYGFSDKATSEYDYVNAEQMMKLIWQAQKSELINNGLDSATAGMLASNTLLGLTGGYNPYGTGGVSPIDADGNVIPGASLVYDTNWWDIITQTATRQDLNVSFSGASEKTRHYISGSFLDSDGFMLGSKFKRANGRVNIDTDVRDWITVGANVAFANSVSNVPTQGGSAFSNNIGFSRTVSNIYPLYTRDANGNYILDNDGNRIYDWGDNVNGGGIRSSYSPHSPVYVAENNYNRYTRANIDVSPYVDIKLMDGLNLKSQYAYSFYLFGLNEYMDPNFGSGVAVEGRSSKERNTTATYTWFNTLNYQKIFADKHSLSAMLGQELFDNTYQIVGAQSTGFPLPGLDELVNGASPTIATSVTFQNRLYSYFGRADYTYDRRYSLGGSIRRDASSRFIGDNRWGTFWSAAAAWSIHNESFMANAGSISLLKIRASYGEVGNEELGGTSQFLFPYFNTNDLGWNIGGAGGSIPTSNANPNLTWEVHKKTNLGLDFGFFKNRISGTFEIFDTKVSDLIYRRLLPPEENGGLPTWVNSAEMRNKGWELELNSVNVDTEDFTWTTSFSATAYESKIEYIEKQQLANPFNWESGRDRYEFYMQEWAGVDPATGSPQWYADVLDANGDPTGERYVTSDYALAGRYYTGKSALPKIEGRFANTFRYKNFDLNVVAFYRFGNYVYNSDYQGLMSGFAGGNPGDQQHPDILNAWTEPGDITDVPRLALTNHQGSAQSTRWLQKGDFIRLRTVSLGYTFDQQALKGTGIAALRLYATADNYFTWQKEDRIDDPEQSFSGQTSNNSTLMKTMSFGLNVSF